MAKTHPGGAYLSADKKTWHDASGNVIAAPVSASPVIVGPEMETLNAPTPEPVIADKGKGKGKSKDQ